MYTDRITELGEGRGGEGEGSLKSAGGFSSSRQWVGVEDGFAWLC